MIWTAANVGRIILDTAGRILQQPHAGLPTNVPATLDLYADLGMSSLQRMELAAHLNEFFGILHTSAQNYLLANTTLNHWTTCILRARQESDDWVMFRTSGTSGSAKPIRHRLASLLAEAHFLTTILPRPAQVVSTVASQHIYGFIYTVLLPAIWQCPLRLLADVSAAAIGPDTLLVGTPFTWEFVYTSLLSATPMPCIGTTSTAPMPPGLFDKLLDAGVTLTEIYGSSETGGLAYRTAPAAPFTLFPYLTMLTDETSADRLSALQHTETGAVLAVPDRLERVSDRDVRVLGRLDEAIQIAGVNVYPAQIRQTIAACPLVADCDVYAKASADGSQLYGAVRLRTLTDANREACLRWCRDHLSAPELPRHLYVY